MKSYYYFLSLLCCLATTTFAQTTVELNLQHKFEESSFVPGQTYMNNNNKAVLINRIQYYISDLELLYDGGQSAIIGSQNNQCFFIDGETTTYSLGTVAATIQELEQLNFNLGIDATNNNNHPTNYSMGHPLAKTSMYSAAQQSYIFLKIEGMIDTDDDQIPDQIFEFRATGDQLLRSISIAATTPTSTNLLKISLVANLSSWLNELDLATVGTQENSDVLNEKLCDNTSDFTVFSNVSTTNVSTIVSPKNHIYIDSRLYYAPTIHYKFYTNEVVDMTITNTNGTYFIQKFNLAPDGDYYMSDDLASGVYIVIFTTAKGIRQSKKFVIRN